MSVRLLSIIVSVSGRLVSIKNNDGEASVIVTVLVLIEIVAIL
jgi:hypothetical protein